MNLLEKYKHLEPVNDMNLVQQAWEQMVEMSMQEQQPYWVEDHDAGSIFLLGFYDTDSKQNYFLEYIKGKTYPFDDSVTTLYRAAPEFGERQRLVDVRKEIISEIGRLFLSLPSVVTIFDQGRSREAHLNELGTAQLLDVLTVAQGKQLALPV